MFHSLAELLWALQRFSFFFSVVINWTENKAQLKVITHNTASEREVGRILTKAYVLALKLNTDSYRCFWGFCSRRRKLRTTFPCNKSCPHSPLPPQLLQFLKRQKTNIKKKTIKSTFSESVLCFWAPLAGKDINYEKNTMDRQWQRCTKWNNSFGKRWDKTFIVWRKKEKEKKDTKRLFSCCC